MPDVTAVILAGGKGTRLRSVVPNLPKCLAEVNGKPFIFYILKQLATIKVKRIILAVNYLGEMISLQVGTKYLGIPIYYSYDEIENGGTGHALRSSLHLIDTDHVLVMNGDTYVDFSLATFIYKIGMDYGNTGFVLNINSGITSMGIYFTYRDFISECIPYDTPYVLETSFLNDVYRYGVIPYIINKPFIDIGTPESYAKADEFMRGVGK